MKILSKLALLGAVTALAGLPWVTAAPVVVIYPQEVTGTISLRDNTGAPVPLTSLTMQAAPEGVPWWQSDQLSSTYYSSVGAQPYSWSLILDGGDPLQPSNPGHRYKLGFSGSISTPSGSTTISYRTETLVDVVSGSPLPPQSLALNGLRRINANVVVTNGKLLNFSMTANFNEATANYQMQSSVGFTAAANMTSASLSAPSLPRDSTWVYGSVTVQDGSGRVSQRNLNGLYLNLSSGDGVASWTIDASPTSGIEGIVSFDPRSSGATASGHTVYVSTSGFSASIPVVNGQYAMRGPAGNYNVYINSNFRNPNSSAYGDRSYETVPTDTVIQKNFDIGLNTIRMPLSIDGFYSLDTVTSVYGNLARMRDEGWGLYHWAWAQTQGVANGQLVFPVSDGIWKPYGFGVGIYRSGISASVSKTMFPDPSLPAMNLQYANHTYPAQQLTLVESKVYMDVIEAEGDAQIPLQNPSAWARKTNYGPTSEPISTIEAYGTNSDPASDLASATLVAEPGEYTLTSYVYAGNTQISMPPSTIVFGQPITTPQGSDSAVWTPDDQQDLQVSLNFNTSTPGGTSSVVKTTQGPTPPEGFSTLCSPNQDDPDSCPTIYYDIRTNVPHSAAPVEVCIRQAYQSITDFNGNGSNADEIESVMSSLGLFHFKEGTNCDTHLPPQDENSCWERLGGPLVNNKPLVANCANNLAACGCTSAMDCGISSDVTVIQSCGLTASFSPFAVLQEASTQFEPGGDGASGSITDWSVSTPGVYRITAIGAKGGAGTGSPNLSGGCGAKIDGEFTLGVGESLKILVGQKGLSTPYNGGGGGGSFVVKNGAPLVIAGGGGGVRHASTVNGRDGSLTNNGIAGSTSLNYTSGFVAGGTAGRGGSRASGYGAGGGGWLTAGAADGANGEGGFAYQATGGNAARGGHGLKCDGPPYADGGFGGGGAGNGCYGGGGGGGYSGGGGGRIGGGGGSWNNGANPHASVECTGDGDGRVRIKWLRR